MSKNSQFEKFINKTRGSAIKEQFKQEKKIAKKERAAAIEKRFEEKRKSKLAPQPEPAKKTGGIAAPKTLKRSTGHTSSDTSMQAEQMPINKYIAHSGISGRREAAELVRSGEVTLNGEVITEPGTKVSEHDEVTVTGKKIGPSKNFVYILLNKP
ncbi:MAG: S4 domain-containing protein, partial [Chitinophagaceae bacterium]